VLSEKKILNETRNHNNANRPSLQTRSKALEKIWGRFNGTFSHGTFFTAISDIELIPDDWQKGIVKPLHKSGSVYDLDNYRGITLSSNVYKLFTKTLEISVLDHLESTFGISSTPGALPDFNDLRVTEMYSLLCVCLTENHANS
jgi:hypothetical protein